jgi:transcriptional regulator GlxA family with amidase domain
MTVIVDVLVVRPCMAMDISLIIDPLRMVNQLAGKPIVEIRTSTTDGKPIELTNGTVFVPGCGLSDVRDPRIIVIACSRQSTSAERRHVRTWLRRNCRTDTKFYAATFAPFLLAEAGLLAGHKATVHWEVIPALCELHPDVAILEQVCVVDRNITTCAGHCAIADMMVVLVQTELGERLGVALAEELMIPFSRLRDAPQRPLRVSLDGRSIDGRIAEALRIMREQREDPIGVAALAKRVGVSVRQFQKLFTRDLRRSPTSYYSDLRLERGRELLCYTDLTIREVSIACGFGSLAVFCRAFRKRTGQTAGSLRRKYRASFDRARISVLGTKSAIPTHKRSDGARPSRAPKPVGHLQSSRVP